MRGRHWTRWTRWWCPLCCSARATSDLPPLARLASHCPHPLPLSFPTNSTARATQPWPGRAAQRIATRRPGRGGPRRAPRRFAEFGAAGGSRRRAPAWAGPRRLLGTPLSACRDGRGCFLPRFRPPAATHCRVLPVPAVQPQRPVARNGKPAGRGYRGWTRLLRAPCASTQIGRLPRGRGDLPGRGTRAAAAPASGGPQQAAANDCVRHAGPQRDLAQRLRRTPGYAGRASDRARGPAAGRATGRAPAALRPTGPPDGINIFVCIYVITPRWVYVEQRCTADEDTWVYVRHVGVCETHRCM